MTRHIFAYILLLAVFLSAIGLVLHLGSSVSAGDKASQPRAGSITSVASVGNLASAFVAVIGTHYADPFSHLLLQAVVIIVAAGLAGRLAQLIG